MDRTETAPGDPIPNPSTAQTPTSQAPPPASVPPLSSSTPSSIPPTPEFRSPATPMPNQNSQLANPQFQVNLQQQQTNFQNAQQRPPLGRPLPGQAPYQFTPHLPPQIGSSSSSSSSSSLPSSSFSSAQAQTVSSAPMQRSGLAIGLPAQPARPQLHGGSFSAFNSSSFNHQFGGLARNPVSMQDQMSNPNNQGRAQIQGIQTIGMMGSLGSGSQMRPSGINGPHPPRTGQPQMRAHSPQSLANQKFQGPGMLRVQSTSSPGTSLATSQGSQQNTQSWMKGQLPHMSSMTTPANRSHLKPQTLQQRSHHPQQHQHSLPPSQHQQQMSSTQQQQNQPSVALQQQDQQGQQYPLSRIQQSKQSQQQMIRPPASAGQKLANSATVQPTLIQTGPAPTAANAVPSEGLTRILNKRTIHDVIGQIDPSEKLDPGVDDILVEIAEDFVESVTTMACSLAKHRKSTILESKDILLHLERNWNIMLPGFTGDDIKICKKLLTNDVHKERLAAIKKSMIGNDAGNTKSTAGQTTGNSKSHATKAPAPSSLKTHE